ncbi:MAG: carbamoyltransferase C-terminal domain-containing protein [Acidobacteriota bacterium]
MTRDVDELCLGMARARLGPAAALVDRARGIVSACEENRLTRARQASTSGPPALAVAELLRGVGRTRPDVAALAVVADEDKDAREWAASVNALTVDGHQAHATYAFQASRFAEALVLVCEVHKPRGWSAWRFRGGGDPPHAVGTELGEYPLARIYGQFTEALGLQATRDEHLVESMARAGRDSQHALANLVSCRDGRVSVDPAFWDELRRLTAGASEQMRNDVAASVQRRLGECLADLLRRLAALVPDTPALSVVGGLYFNTHFTTVAATCGAFREVHVPAHPGRNGASVGAAILASESGAAGGSGLAPVPALVASPYLGPAYQDTEIKEALENCKLSYNLMREQQLVDAVLHALSRGQLVGWFHGRLEWGPRALGHRSVLADPLAPHTLGNLNGFLKRRPAYRSYGVSTPLASLGDLFEGPPASPFMQYEYRPRDPERFRTILPPGVETLRVHTVDESEPRFLGLLQRWGEKTGTPVLVNTSFNGFHEPLVCSPRDAIRVFYGTGLDVLALDDFFLHK